MTELTDISVNVSSPPSIPSKENLLNLMLASFTNGALDKYNIKLSPSDKNFITEVLNSAPSILNDIKATVLNILRDNRINSADIPELITLVKQIFQLIESLKNVQINPQECAEKTVKLVQFIITILIDENIIDITENQEIVINELSNLLVACIGLMNLPTTVPNLKKVSCC